MSKKKAKKKSITPLMQQYQKMKSKYPDAILLYRVGDFYETFGTDAITVSEILGIVLTSRNNGGSDIELAGFPHHSLNIYLPRLVKAGYRVALCEQLEKPTKGKKIVRRGVTEVVTPGLATDDQLLESDKNNFIASIYAVNNKNYGISFLDISTGEFIVTEGSLEDVDKFIQSFGPNEILVSKSEEKDIQKLLGKAFYIYSIDDWIYTEDYAIDKLKNHFKVQNLKGYGIEDITAGQVAAGAILHYLETTENNNIQHISSISRIQKKGLLWLDKFTIRNLELIDSTQVNGKPLLKVLDLTITPMGGRLMRNWIVMPLTDQIEIQKRLDITEYFYNHDDVTSEISSILKKIGDLERIISKIPLAKINPRELRQLAKSLDLLHPIKKILSDTKLESLNRLSDQIMPCQEAIKLIERTIKEEPPVNLSKGYVIEDGAHEELDELRNIISNSKQLLADIQNRESEKTGISSLKIGFNNVFGYYLEVTNKYKGKGLIPDDWTRKQTLTNSERYITEELKILEEKILTAEEKTVELELEIFSKLVNSLQEYIHIIQLNAKIVAQLDCQISFSTAAHRYSYNKPEINEGLDLEIKDGRHPVIENFLEIGESYVPNDINLDPKEQQVLMITGPNMSGKSAILRQTALICLMAQMGSFVPATSAKIGILDKIFTRVGASDNISSGESTFMVEMTETASILNNLSSRSLILLDEIGRGTSTYDGISIAWAIAEYLNMCEEKPKTLFATHYHELNELEEKHAGIRNFHVSTHETKEKVIFLRKLKRGGSEHSFGIHVAKMAGMPQFIINRSNQILSLIETKIDKEFDGKSDGKREILKQIKNPEHLQLSIFDHTDSELLEIKKQLQNIDLHSLTPIECMLKLKEFKEKLDD